MLLDDIPRGIYLVDELLSGTNTRYGEYLSYYMKDFTIGENIRPEGLLMDRVVEIRG